LSPSLRKGPFPLGASTSLQGTQGEGWPDGGTLEKKKTGPVTDACAGGILIEGSEEGYTARTSAEKRTEPAVVPEKRWRVRIRASAEALTTARKGGGHDRDLGLLPRLQRPTLGGRSDRRNRRGSIRLRMACTSLEASRKGGKGKDPIFEHLRKSMKTEAS